MNLEITEEERQLVLLALAILSLERPGFDRALNLIAIKMDNELEGRALLYDNFRATEGPALRFDRRAVV